MRKYLPEVLKVLSKISPGLAAKIALHFFATPVRIPRPASEMAWYESSKKYFLTSGIAAFEWGEPTDPLVLLIHGWNGRGTQLASFAPALVEKKFRVVALDGPGHGISPGSQTNPTHFAQFIIDSQNELLSHSEVKSSRAVIAHSFGGGCSVLALTRGLKTDGLVLIASPAYYERVVTFFAKSVGLSSKAEEKFIQMVAAVAGLHPREIDIGKIGSHYTLPVLVVHDEGDTAVDFMSAKAITTAWSHSQLFATQGLGHRRILKDQKVIEAVTNFVLTLRS